MVQKSRRGSRPKSHLLLADQISGALNAVVLLDEHKIHGGRVSSPVPTPPRHSHQFANSRAKGPGLALRVAKAEYCRVWREQAGRVAISGPEFASGRGAVLAGGVLNPATDPRLAKGPRGQGLSDGLAGPGV